MRIAFKMKLKPGCEAVYQQRHQELWPELEELLKTSGIRDYSIFLDRETNTLFAIQKIEGPSGSQDLGNHPVVRRWWKYMADIMETNPDASPRTTPLFEVFHLD